MGRPFEEHLNNLSMVLARLQAAGLMLKPEKCNFFQKEVLYLGHIVSEQGVNPNPEKIEKDTNPSTHVQYITSS